jgi:hypothetical protein
MMQILINESKMNQESSYLKDQEQHVSSFGSKRRTKARVIRRQLRGKDETDAFCFALLAFLSSSSNPPRGEETKEERKQPFFPTT